MRKTILLAAAATAIGIASVANATPPPPTPATSLGGCAGAEALFGATAVACTGYYPGQDMSGNSNDIATQINALTPLGITGLTQGTFNFGSYPNIGLNGTSTSLDFSQVLSGLTVIGIHWGNVPDPLAPTFPVGSGAHNLTAFIEFDLPAGTTSIPILNANGISGAVLYGTGQTPPVPEPSTWAMMLLGFGATGFAVRRSRSKALLTQIA